MFTVNWSFDEWKDAILISCNFPFSLDQSHEKDIARSFKPPPDSSSFQCPKTDMNIASGFPQFAKLCVLEDPSYVKDDVMYIKCIVDTTKIFHP